MRNGIPDGELPPIHKITMQGSLLTWKVFGHNFKKPKSKKGRKVVGFSKASRLKLIKVLATIDWTQASPCLFVTLTYPDECQRSYAAELSKDRSWFWRQMEDYAKRQLSCIWRMEWKERQSGELKGQWMPHYHLMVFNYQWIEHEAVNEMWRNALGHAQYVRTEVKRMANPSQAGYYVCKYQAKPEDCSLVNGVHLNCLPGRQWGILRRKCLPLAEKVELSLADGEAARLARKKAAEAYKGIDLTQDQSFTLIGKRAEEIWAIFEQMALTEGDW
jgi:hypothetical protein